MAQGPTKKDKDTKNKKDKANATAAASKKENKSAGSEKKVTRGRRKKEPTPESDGDEDNRAPAQGEPSDDIDVDWTVDLTWKLVNTIMEDEVIKQGLFPASKGNQSISKGGSKSKTDHYWALAEHVFTGDPTYSGVFSRRKTESADQKTWGRKIKNRLQRIIKDTRTFMDEMGQTGMGIMKETELDMSLENHLTNCWTRIREKHPWFWTIKSIISERPNIVHTGVGNANEGFDMSYLGGGDLSSDGPSGVENDVSHSAASAYESDDWKTIKDSDGDQSDTSTEATEREKKRKRDPDSVANVKKVSTDSVAENKQLKRPRESKSTPAAASTKKPKPVKGIERFGDVAAREEQTTQMALDLKKAKVLNEREKSVAKVKAQADIKMHKDKLRAELAQKKLELEYQFKLQMAQMGHAQQNTFAFSNNGFASSSTGGGNNFASSSTGGGNNGNADGAPWSLTDDMNHLNYNLFQNYNENQ